MYTGGGPLARNAARSSGGEYDEPSFKNEKPVTFRCAGQSGGLGMRACDQR